MRELTSGSKKFTAKADTGFKAFCNIPDSVALDIMTRYHINIHSAETVQEMTLKLSNQLLKGTTLS